jgi:ERCC4-type nuclease
MAAVAALIDAREPDPLKALTFGGVPTTILLLDAGDFHLATDDDALIAVERKAPGDLLASIKAGRLKPQLARLRELTPWAYLLITGRLEPTCAGYAATERGETGFLWAAVDGFLLDCQEMGVGVVRTPTATPVEVERALLRLADRHRGGVRIAPARPHEWLSDEETLLSAFRGIGPERANAVLKFYRSVGRALAELTNIQAGRGALLPPGIGRKTQMHLRDVLGLSGWDRLAIIGFEIEESVAPVVAEAAAGVAD